MEIDPMEHVENQNEEEEKEAARKDKKKSQLNNFVAITVAILATFTGICKVKDDNICQAMQQTQATKIDSWNFYQARNIREEIANATVAQLQLQEAAAPPALKAGYEKQIALYGALAKKQHEEKEKVKQEAENADVEYARYNIHDDQFDLSDALVAISISLLALTALTQKQWLFWVSMAPTMFGILMGLAGLLGWGLHPGTLTSWLGT